MRLNKFILTTSRFQSDSSPADGEITIPEPEVTAANFACLGDGTSSDQLKRAYNTTTTAGYNVVINNDRTKFSLSSSPAQGDEGIWLDIVTVEESK